MVTQTTGNRRQKRQEIAEAAAEILREKGPTAVSHRTVAKRAGCSLSATTYYFDGLEELLFEAGNINIARWAGRAERAADQCEATPVPRTNAEKAEAIMTAMLPLDVILLGHYMQLVAAGESDPVSRAYRSGRSRLDAAVSRVLTRVGAPITAALAIAVVDGAAVAALSEGRDVRETAHSLLEQILQLH